jgi:hypothetical protein
MDRERIEDKGSCNPVVLEELERQMPGWLEGSARKIDLRALPAGAVRIPLMLPRFT